MEDKTRNIILIICAVLLTSSFSYAVINRQINENKAITSIENLGRNTSKQFKGSINKSSEKALNKIIRSLENKVKNQKQSISKLNNEKRKLNNELVKLKKRFAVQIRAEEQKNKISWSDGTTKPKYNQTQEGLKWSDK